MAARRGSGRPDVFLEAGQRQELGPKGLAPQNRFFQKINPPPPAAAGSSRRSFQLDAEDYLTMVSVSVFLSRFVRLR